MHLMYFTEQPMSAYDAQAGLDFGATALMFSNRHFDPVAGSPPYKGKPPHPPPGREGGFDGLQRKQHPHAPLCMRGQGNGVPAGPAAMTRPREPPVARNP